MKLIQRIAYLGIRKILIPAGADNIRHIPGSHHIPLEELRDRLDELDADKTIYVNCQTGLRSYIACRILEQNGFACRNLAGGYRLYESVMLDRCAAEEAFPCGMDKR